MAMGSKKTDGCQADFWVATQDLPSAPGHPFYTALNRILDAHGFDAFVESRCARFYAKTMGRPSLPPGRYLRLLLIGFFEGLDSERGIAWRVADSRSLCAFLGLGVGDSAPHHSTLSNTRNRIDLETHHEVFTWVLQLLAKGNLLRGKTIGVDATPLEANAAMRSIVRRDTGETYRQYLIGLAKESGIETPTNQDLKKIDQARKNKASNKDWTYPRDPDARVTKLKNGSTHLAYKAEHAVDLETGALVGITLHPGDAGDTDTLAPTLDEVEANLDDVARDEDARQNIVAESQRIAETIADAGYHSDAVLAVLDETACRSYVAEPDRGRRKWKGDLDARGRVYANRRRTGGERGKSLMRLRSELNERSNAHMYETGGMRRVWLRGIDNIGKRLLVHAAGFNLALAMRDLFGAGKPREWASRGIAAKAALMGIGLFLWQWATVFGGLGKFFDKSPQCQLAVIRNSPLPTIRPRREK